MPHTGVSLDRIRDRKCSHPLSARRSIRPTAWPAAFAAAPTEARPWSMKLASTLGRFLKLSKPGRAMPGKTSVTRIGDRLSTSSLEDRLEGGSLGVRGERGGEAGGAVWEGAYARGPHPRRAHECRKELDDLDRLQEPRAEEGQRRRGGVVAQERAQEEVDEAEASRAVRVPDPGDEGGHARPLREGG